jgi:serine protease Do
VKPVLFVLSLAICASRTIPASAQSLLEQMEREVTSIVREARPGVVTVEDMRPGPSPAPSIRSGAEEGKPLRSGKGRLIEKEKYDTQGSTNTAQGSSPRKVGSGFVIEPEFVVTTADVLEGMDQPSIVTDKGERYRGIVVQIDHELNIGLLRLPESARISPMKLGTSAGVESGRFAIAIGNQVGQPNAVAITLVSGWRKEGSFAGRRFYPSLIQVAGSLGAGSSGSPLVNSRAEVIGMLVAVGASDGSRDGIATGGYALPIDDVRATVKLMANMKRYLRAWLGADLKEEARVDTKPNGSMTVTRTVSVEIVHPESPAERAGLKRGDRLVSLNGAAIGRMAEVRAAVVQLKPGEKLTFVVRRENKDLSITVPFSVRPLQ